MLNVLGWSWTQSGTLSSANILIQHGLGFQI